MSEKRKLHYVNSVHSYVITYHSEKLLVSTDIGTSISKNSNSKSYQVKFGEFFKWHNLLD